MKKRSKVNKKTPTNVIKKITPDPSKCQPYRPIFIPWALKYYKRFLTKRESHSFKTQGGVNFFLLERARKAYEKGDYEREWLNDSRET